MDEKPRNSSVAIVTIAVVVLLLPALYILSTGPAVWMLKNGIITDDQLHTAYAPVAWLAEHVPLFAQVIEAYARLWVGDWIPRR